MIGRSLFDPDNRHIRQTQNPLASFTPRGCPLGKMRHGKCSGSKLNACRQFFQSSTERTAELIRTAATKGASHVFNETTTPVFLSKIPDLSAASQRHGRLSVCSWRVVRWSVRPAHRSHTSSDILHRVPAAMYCAAPGCGQHLDCVFHEPAWWAASSQW